jgi:hypothetical protein
MPKIKTMTAADALEKLRNAGYMVDYRTVPGRPLAIRFYCDLSKPDVAVRYNLVDAGVIDKLCKDGPISSLMASMK